MTPLSITIIFLLIYWIIFQARRTCKLKKLIFSYQSRATSYKAMCDEHKTTIKNQKAKIAKDEQITQRYLKQIETLTERKTYYETQLNRIEHIVKELAACIWQAPKKATQERVQPSESPIYNIKYQSDHQKDQLSS